MSMGHKQPPAAELLPQGQGLPFYQKLEAFLVEHDFDRFVEELCRKFYARKLGRPSMPPGLYFRALLMGYFEGLGSERAIAWRIQDSLSLRAGLGFSLSPRKLPDGNGLGVGDGHREGAQAEAGRRWTSG